jgi:HK97 family phage major capsid protein
VGNAHLMPCVIRRSSHDEGQQMTKQELIEDRGRLLNEAEAILLKAKEENRFDLSGEENAKWEKLHAEADARKAFIDKLEKHESLSEPTGRRSEAPQPVTRGDNGRTTRVTNQERTDALRAWLLAGTDEGVTPEMREKANRAGINVDNKRMTMRLSDSETVRALRDEGAAAWEKRTAQGTTSGAVGQYLVPDEMMKALEVSLLAHGGMRSVATILRTGSGASLPIPTVNDTAVKGRILTENVEATETGMSFGQLVLESYKYSSDYVLVSVELLQDSSINVAEFIGSALGTRIARITNEHFTTANGSSKPNGIVAAAGSGVTGVADPPTYDNFVDLIHSVDPAYRNNAKFMLNDATLKTIKKIKVLQYSGDTTGTPLWQPSMVSGSPDTILGFQYVINQDMASPGSSAKKVIFGDLSKYLIRDVRDVSLLRLDERFATLHQVAFLAFSRHDGDLLDAGTDPVKYMSQA